MDTCSLDIPAGLDSIPALHRFVEKSALALSIGGEDLYDLRLAVEEAATNTINHGYQGRKGMIRIEISRKENTVSIHMRDRAREFNPTAFTTADRDVPLSRRPAGGRGLLLLRESVDEIRHAPAEGGGNHLILIKHLEGQAAEPDPDAPRER